MIKTEFTAWLPVALMILLALLLVWVVVTDIRTRTISNRLNLTVAALAPLFWWATGLSLWPGIAIQIGLALGIFFVCALLFQAGLMGGGDVKLAAALALWFEPSAMLRLLIIMSLVGGVLTLFVMWRHRRKRALGAPAVPYGVAIAVGGWATLAQRYLNHFA